MRRALVTAALTVSVLILVFAGAAMTQDQPEADGTVTIEYTYSRIPGPGSNQWAIWIENSGGELVKTLFLPDYSGRRQGLQARPMMLTTWREKADTENMAQDAIDALSTATPAAGELSVTWDLTDTNGDMVAPGTYSYYIEACLLMENHELWSGDIVVGSDAATSKPELSHFPAGADTIGRSLITEVMATYTPAP